jgi:putative FmdB family regulatory protein
MPTYVYRREDGTTFEIEQRITEDALEVCPTTGQPVTRVITGGTGLIFKGNGFYLTDYVRNNGNGKSKAAESNAGASDSAPSKDAKSKPAENGQ